MYYLLNNLATAQISNWYGTLIVKMNCVSVLKYALIQIIVSMTTGLAYDNQYNTYGSNDFTFSSYSYSANTNNIFLIYQWMLRTDTTFTCYSSSIEFAAQFRLQGTPHSIVNDTYFITTLTTTNINTTITGHF